MTDIDEEETMIWLAKYPWRDRPDDRRPGRRLPWVERNRWGYPVIRRR